MIAYKGIWYDTEDEWYNLLLMYYFHKWPSGATGFCVPPRIVPDTFGFKIDRDHCERCLESCKEALWRRTSFGV